MHLNIIACQSAVICQTNIFSFKRHAESARPRAYIFTFLFCDRVQDGRLRDIRKLGTSAQNSDKYESLSFTFNHPSLDSNPGGNK